jgi:hypothetical protein
MSQGYVIVADGAPLRPDDILALMPPIERQFVVEHTPTMLAFAVYVANLLREDVAPTPRLGQPVTSRPRRRANATAKSATKTTAKKTPRGGALAAIAEALHAEPTASLARLHDLTGYSRSYCCEVRRKVRKGELQ